MATLSKKKKKSDSRFYRTRVYIGLEQTRYSREFHCGNADKNRNTVTISRRIETRRAVINKRTFRCVDIAVVTPPSRSHTDSGEAVVTRRHKTRRLRARFVRQSRRTTRVTFYVCRREKRVVKRLLKRISNTGSAFKLKNFVFFFRTSYE